MNKILEFTNNERKIYGNILSTFIFSIDSIKDFLPEKKLNLRKYVNLKEILQNYIDLTKEMDRKADGKGIFEAFKSDEKYKDELIQYKRKFAKEFQQIDKCLKCSCLKCYKECNFNPCLSCMANSHVHYCDKNEFNMIKFQNKVIELENNENILYKFKVLAIITNCKKFKEYILLENVNDSDDMQMFYLIRTTETDEYKEIKDPDEIDEIAEIYLSNSCSEEGI